MSQWIRKTTTEENTIFSKIQNRIRSEILWIPNQMALLQVLGENQKNKVSSKITHFEVIPKQFISIRAKEV